VHFYKTLLSKSQVKALPVTSLSISAIDLQYFPFQTFMQELKAYEKSVQQMLKPSDPDEKLKDKTLHLEAKWKRVLELSDNKEERLQEALSFVSFLSRSRDRVRHTRIATF
jgi:endonuclease III